MILKYIIIFIVFSVLGWMYEYMLFNRTGPDGITKKLFDFNLPILPIYGVAGVLLLFIHENFNSYSMLQKVIIASILLNFMECLFGLSSYEFYGYQTWKYESNTIPMCHGYISLLTWIWWTFFIYLFFKGMDIIKTKHRRWPFDWEGISWPFNCRA
jgi:uncharacterized membrane protein